MKMRVFQSIKFINKLKSMINRSNTPDGRKIQEIMNKLDKVIVQGYTHAVMTADKNNPNEVSKSLIYIQEFYFIVVMI